MTKGKFLKLSLIFTVIALLSFALTYFFFHYVTDDGITSVWQQEAGKPVVTYMIGAFAVLNFFSGVTSFILANVIYGRNSKIND